MKNYLVIGASSGIGKNLAISLADNGHQVIGTYNTNKDYPSIAGLNYHYLNVLDDSPDLSFLPEKLDGLVYMPGSINLKPFVRLKPLDLISDFNLSVIGAIKVIQQALPLLKKSNYASIILFASIAAEIGFNYHSLISISKGSIEGLTKALAAELAPAIRVNCIAPSLTDTPLASNLLSTEEKKAAHAERHPLKRIGRPEDIAGTAEFLLSEKSSWITGQIIHVDGGLSTIK